VIIDKRGFKALFEQMKLNHKLLIFPAHWETDSQSSANCVAVSVQMFSDNPKFKIEIALSESGTDSVSEEEWINTLRKRVASRVVFLNEFIGAAMDRGFISKKAWRIEFSAPGLNGKERVALDLPDAVKVVHVSGRMALGTFPSESKSLQSTDQTDWF